MAVGKAVNVGTGKDWTILETTKILMEISKKKARIISDKKRIRPPKSEVERLIADNSLLKEITDWKQKVSFKNGLKKTINWIKNNEKFFQSGSYKI